MDRHHQYELADLIARFAKNEGSSPTSLPGVNCLKFSAPGAGLPVVYSPCLCLIVQGKKEVLLEDERYTYQPSEFLVVSVDLPVVGQVTQASSYRPYLCLQIDIDVQEVRDLLAQRSNGASLPALKTTERGLFVGKVDDAMLDTALRLTRLLTTPQDIPVLAPMLRRELFYRVLSGPYGHWIAQVATQGSNMHRIAEAIHWLKTNFAEPMRIETMAEQVHMSPSSFHQHFKAVTAMSPLQYQKRLRLLEARRLMLLEELDASTTAYRVGYESPSQFSREYARMFGAPPIRDIEQLRTMAG